MKLPLYVTIIEEHFVRCRKEDGIVNWTNTRQYSIQEMREILQSGQQIHIVKHEGDENRSDTGPDWMNKILKGL